ncbi:hypothetical protein LCGC14_2276370, partial [marine sediment metagenome]
AGIRGTYRVTADVTLSSGGGDLVIHPGLIDVIVDGDVVTIIGSTLNTQLERIIVRLAAGTAGVSKTQNATNTGDRAYSEYERMELKAQAELERMKNRREPRTSETFPKDGVVGLIYYR